jgi:hypothetical protein
VCLPTAGVGIALLQLEPSIRAGIGEAKPASSTDTPTERFRLAEYDGSVTSDLPEFATKPLNAYGPCTWMRRSTPLRSALSSAAFGRNEKLTG